MHILIQLGLVLAAWRWGDWKRWRNYYPTILFFIVGDLLNNFVNYNYSLWTFHPIGFEDRVYRNHTLISLGVDVFGFPSLVLLYLGNFPQKSKLRVGLYVLGWIIFLSLIEAISHFWVKGILYSNGWNYGWSALTYLFVLTILRIHYLRPLLAWGISIAAIIAWLCLGVPIQTMK